MTQRWKQRPPGSNWGEFGPEDQRGRMNYVTREKVLQGIAEVKEGITFSLSLPLDYPGGNVLNPRRSAPRIAATIRDGKSAGKQNFCFALAEDNPDLTDVVSDDLVLLTLQYSTQWDSFAHIGSRFDADGDGRREVVFYNGFRGGEHVVPSKGVEAEESWARYEGTEARALGIQNLAEHGAQGRGVMIDLHRRLGRAHRAVGYDELMKLMDEDRLEVYGTDAKLTVDRYRSLRVEALPATAGGTVGLAVARFLGELAALPYALRKSRAPLNDPSFPAALEAFVRSVRSGSAASPDVTDGLRSIAVIEAAELSARTGRAVSLGADAEAPSMSLGPAGDLARA